MKIPEIKKETKEDREETKELMSMHIDDIGINYIYTCPVSPRYGCLVS